MDARQRHALAQLQDLTNATDEDVAISVLDSVGWDVQVHHPHKFHLFVTADPE